MVQRFAQYFFRSLRRMCVLRLEQDDAQLNVLLLACPPLVSFLLEGSPSPLTKSLLCRLDFRLQAKSERHFMRSYSQ